MTSRPTAPSRPTATAGLLRAVAAFGTVGALALAGVSGPATAQTDAPAATESSAAAESKGKIKGSVKLENGKKFSAAFIEVYRKVPEGGVPEYGGVWQWVRYLSFGGSGGSVTTSERPLASGAPVASEWTKRWDYAVKKLPAGKYRLVSGATGKAYYGPQAYKDGATVLSGDTFKVKAGKTKQIDFKLVKAKKEMTDVEVAIAGDLVVGETLTASVTGAPSGADLLVGWYRTDDYTIVGGGESLTLTPGLAGATLLVYANVYKLGWVAAWASTVIGPISTAE